MLARVPWNGILEIGWHSEAPQTLSAEGGAGVPADDIKSSRGSDLRV